MGRHLRVATRLPALRRQGWGTGARPPLVQEDHVRPRLSAGKSRGRHPVPRPGNHALGREGQSRGCSMGPMAPSGMQETKSYKREEGPLAGVERIQHTPKVESNVR